MMTTDSEHLLAEAELVGRAQAGEPDALDDLISAVRPGILRYCHFRLGSYSGGHDAADDTVQETCLAVVHVLPTYVDQGLPFSAWVYAIAANKVADARRRFGRAALLMEDLPEQEEASPTPEESLIVSVELQTALALVERLPAGMRQVLLLRAAGASAKTVAQELGMSAGAVDVAHHRALARLRELVEESAEFRELFAAFRSGPPEHVSYAA